MPQTKLLRVLSAWFLHTACLSHHTPCHDLEPNPVRLLLTIASFYLSVRVIDILYNLSGIDNLLSAVENINAVQTMPSPKRAYR